MVDLKETMMRKLLLTAVSMIPAMLLPATVLGLAMSQPYGDGPIRPNSRTGEVAPELVQVMNFPGRVYGDSGFFSELGDWENLYFAGDVEALNRFLQLYARVPVKPLTLSLHTGKGLARGWMTAAPEKPAPCDWSFTRHLAGSKRAEGEPNETVHVSVWLGGGISLDGLRVPENVEVSSGGEIERFVQQHQMRRKGLFAIYLLADGSMNGRDAARVALASLKLQGNPLITEDDIVEYRWQTHSLVLKPGAEKRFPSPGVWGIPFVLVADGKSQYLGAFWTHVSSASFEHPVIATPRFGPKGEPGTAEYTIDRAYPGATAEMKDDPRENETVRTVLQSLGKLMP